MIGHPKMLKKTWGSLEYQSNPDFRILMDNLNDTYQQLLQEATRADLQQLRNLRLIECIGNDVYGYPVFCLYGMFLPMGQQMLQPLYLYFLKTMEQLLLKVEVRYNMVYFNSVCCDYRGFLKFKQMFKTLPLKFYAKLEKIIVVHPNFAIRSLQWLSFGTLNHLVSQYIVLASNLQELVLLGLLNNQSVERLPKQILNSEEQSLQQQRLSTEGETLRKKISQRNEVLGIDFDHYEMSEIGVPTLLKMLLAYFIIKPDMLLHEGLFRKNANIIELEQLENECRCKNYEFIGQVTDPHVICGLVKKMFYHSKYPLFSFECYDKIAREKQPESIQFLETMVLQMSVLNHRIFQFLVEFLKYKVAAKEQSNKMNAYSLSVVFAPCLFRPREYKMEDMVNSIKFVKVLQTIITNFERLFGDYEHQSQVYRRSSDQQNQQSRRWLATRVLKSYDPSKDKLRRSIPMSEILRFDD